MQIFLQLATQLLRDVTVITEECSICEEYTVAKFNDDAYLPILRLSRATI